MGKIINKGLLPPDDPIFTGGVEFFSTRRKPTLPTIEGMTEEQQAAMEKVAKLFDTSPQREE